MTSLYYIVPSAKTVADAARDLEAAVQKHGFGVLHVYDLKDTLTRKGYPLGPQCRIFEVCNPKIAGRVLSADMRLNMALPCRISVFTEGGQTKIGLIRPVEMLSALSPDPTLVDAARDVERATIAMVDEAR